MTPRELDAALAKGTAGLAPVNHCKSPHVVAVAEWRKVERDHDGDFVGYKPCSASDNGAELMWVWKYGGYWYEDCRVGEVPHYSTTWEGFGMLMEEAERRGYEDVVFCTLVKSVRCTLIDEHGNHVDGELAPDKRMALALACAKAAGISVE